MTRDGLKIRTQQAIDYIPTLMERDDGWEQIENILYEILTELDDKDDNWHSGTPAEDGWYLVAYECAHECKNKGKHEYHTMHILEDEFGYKDIRGRASDDVWKAVAWQKIEPYKEANND